MGMLSGRAAQKGKASNSTSVKQSYLKHLLYSQVGWRQQVFIYSDKLHSCHVSLSMFLDEVLNLQGLDRPFSGPTEEMGSISI